MSKRKRTCPTCQYNYEDPEHQNHECSICCREISFNECISQNGMCEVCEYNQGHLRQKHNYNPER